MTAENTPATPFQTALLLLGGAAFGLSVWLEFVPLKVLAGTAIAFWALFMLLLAMALATELYVSVRANTKYSPEWGNIAMFPFAAWMIAAPIAGALATSTAGITMLYEWARAPQTSELLVLWLSVPATLLLGGTAFLFRLRLRCLYGISEVGAGLFVAWFQVRGGSSGNLLSGAFLLAFITAAVYLVVRGLDNVHQGWKAEPPDPFAALLKARLASKAQKQPSC
ncbi:hypothetical protein [Variovorax paradoxus]|uniref:Uncharacterized protein n=1 Tax=Variovorax paradoxus TaxID=34073 RepID=A0A6I6HGM2_VARPD|nr:hypothetical protein [Variovorax paradoxus]QGW82118.1 hypothetical protein GOQ09_11205 [Variovorax paradoxus]